MSKSVKSLTANNKGFKACNKVVDPQVFNIIRFFDTKRLLSLQNKKK